MFASSGGSGHGGRIEMFTGFGSITGTAKPLKGVLVAEVAE
ncbi:hypothetical protein OG948_33520 [Embleya sp. NBC_00888]|nr:hypothetical protein OG948_33520 [Embleya sp. NBC_00888]